MRVAAAGISRVKAYLKFHKLFGRNACLFLNRGDSPQLQFLIHENEFKEEQNASITQQVRSQKVARSPLPISRRSLMDVRP